MKRRKENKQGISLIVLVITIIVMIILAGAIIITLGNSGIIGKANEAVDTTNLKQVQQAATLAWADAYAGGARTETELKASVEESLKDIDTSNYTITVTEQGVTVEVKIVVPSEWAENVTAIVDGVPIPKGFVASPYGADEENGIPAENTKDAGLVIYQLTDDEITNGVTALPTTETQFTSWTTRNQYVWVPVDNFETEFVRKDFINETSKVVDDNGSYNALGTSSVYWEVIVDEATNLPLTTIEEQSATYMSDTTLAEAQAMYASVKEYGGFYIARYEAGGDEVDSTTKYGRGNLSITMGKYPYNGVKWGTSMSNEVLEGGAVTLARGMYPDSSTNTTGVVSTLTYGVQWDRTLDWIKSVKGDSFSLTSSSENGNYNDTTLDSTVFNPNAKYASATYNSNSTTTGYYDVGTWTAATSFTTRSGNYIMTTGALSKANLCNIYDMAGNIYEWTMEGLSTSARVYRGGTFTHAGTNAPVSYRYGIYNPASVNARYGFRPSLYIKK